MTIKRARGYRLYTTKGKKILDLSMDYGRAVLGHRPNGLSLSLKNTIDRGIYSRYNNIYKKRLVKELNKRFPDYPNVTILEYEDKVKEFSNSEIYDPLFDSKKNLDDAEKEISYWRPFLKIPNSKHLIILYPLPGLNTTTIVVSRSEIELNDDCISPVLLCGILRSINDYDLELKKFKPKNYIEFNNIGKTTLKPPYLLFNDSPQDYIKRCQKALESDILLNVRSPFAVLGNEYSLGEIKKLLEHLK